MKLEVDYSLYLVTDRGLMAQDSIDECVEQAIRGGCTVVQLREKEADSREFHEIAMRLRDITAQMDVPLIINDRVDIALAVDADGVHIGQEDLPCDAVRRILGRDKIIGVSTGTLDEALLAVKMGADYLGVGAMFATGTKTDADITSIDELICIRKAVDIPIVAIGGINKDTIPLFKGTGIDGVAVVSAVVSQKNAQEAARELGIDVRRTLCRFQKV